MRIDIFNHFMPRAYLDRLAALVPDHVAATAFPRLKTLVDVDARLRLLDRFDDVRQVLSLANPPLELIAAPAQATELARVANDPLADICRRHPDRFPAFIASFRQIFFGTPDQNPVAQECGLKSRRSTISRCSMPTPRSARMRPRAAAMRSSAPTTAVCHRCAVRRRAGIRTDRQRDPCSRRARHPGHGARLSSPAMRRLCSGSRGSNEDRDHHREAA